MNGFVIIVDWSEFTFKQSTWIQPHILKLMIEGLQVRTVDIHRYHWSYEWTNIVVSAALVMFVLNYNYSWTRWKLIDLNEKVVF